MNLYFIALIPHHELREEIRALKEELKERFNVKHALKSPAHITLHMPFKRSSEDEPHIIHTLEYFASRQHSFSIALSGFGCFSSRVIFVRVENHQSITHLHAQLNEALINQMGFNKNAIKPEVHPHLTIATRDLYKAAFKEAWPEFQKREFKASFTAKSIFLLKHNGRHWDIYREFFFDN